MSMFTIDQGAGSVDSISGILAAMKPISLTEMDRVKLMDRSETKFVFPSSLLPMILASVSENYTVLEVNGKRMSVYETVYFDTDDHSLYLMHHNGRANRYKFRIRTYVETGVSYYEFKQKTPKKRTIKRRLEGDSADAAMLSPTLFHHVAPQYRALISQLSPVLKVQHTRTTLVNPESAERITIDTGLVFMAGISSRNMTDICIAEVKQEKNAASRFTEMMRRHHIMTLRFSKYCQGMIAFYPSIKKNNFKPRIRQLEKILKTKPTITNQSM
jgi:hypothetical protein